MHPLVLMVTGKTGPLKTSLKGTRSNVSVVPAVECFSRGSGMGFNGKGEVNPYSIRVSPCLWLLAYSVVRSVTEKI